MNPVVKRRMELRRIETMINRLRFNSTNEETRRDLYKAAQLMGVVIKRETTK